MPCIKGSEQKGSFSKKYVLELENKQAKLLIQQAIINTEDWEEIESCSGTYVESSDKYLIDFSDDYLNKEYGLVTKTTDGVILNRLNLKKV